MLHEALHSIRDDERAEAAPSAGPPRPGGVGRSPISRCQAGRRRRRTWVATGRKCQETVDLWLEFLDGRAWVCMRNEPEKGAAGLAARPVGPTATSRRTTFSGCTGGTAPRDPLPHRRRDPLSSAGRSGGGPGRGRRPGYGSPALHPGVRPSLEWQRGERREKI